MTRHAYFALLEGRVSLPMAITMIALLLFSIVLAISSRYVRRNKLLPPGPKGLPIVGNLLDLPVKEKWKVFDDMGKEFGDVVYLEVFGSPIVVLNGVQATMDLLDKRSVIYSDRPQLPMACDLCAFDNLVPLTRFGERFRLERKLMNQALSPRAIAKWEPFAEEEVHILLANFLNKPDDLLSHIRRMSVSLIFTAMYGYRITDDHDPVVSITQDFMDISSYAIAGGWIVDFLPFLRWIPFTSFARLASQWRRKHYDWVERPYLFFQQNQQSVTVQNSFCWSMLFDEHGTKVNTAMEERIKWIATSVYGGGSDSTVAAISQFLLAMVLHPNALKKAQQEIDNVVGRNRLPTLRDRESLPYIECVLKESLRWGTPVPLTPPHRLMQDDEYRGYIIPEGTICVANMWALLHDEKIYQDPHQFLPERYADIKDPEQARLMDPATYIFGFGRRRCPGISFSGPPLWLTVVSIIACFSLTPALNDEGDEVPPLPKFSSGAIRHPEAFECKITPRHPGVPVLIEQWDSKVEK